MTQEALKLALEALENGDVPTPENVGKNLDAITAIKEALAQTQEPHGWYIDGYGAVIGTAEPKSVRVGEWLPWYTTPPQRTWVGLTAEEKKNIFLKWYGKLYTYTKQVQAVMDSVEAKLKEKNI
jgi:hypothetical protein